MTTTSQAVDSQAAFPVDALNAGSAELSQDSLLNDLLSGLEDVTATPAAPVSLLEQDMLDLLDVETSMTLAVAGAVVEVPEELVAPVVAAPTMGDAVRAGLKADKAQSKKGAAGDKKATGGKKAGEKAAPKGGKRNAGATEAPGVNAEAGENVKALTGSESGESSPEATTEPQKKTPTPRMTFAKKSEKIVHKLGDKASEFLALDTADLELTEEELKAKQDALLKYIDEELAVKIGEKAVMLMGYLRNGGKLNEIMRRTFTVLLRDGFLTSGSKGNLVTDFERKPYSPGTAASQSNQMFGLFPLLKICHAKSAGRMELNENSTILIKMKAELGL